MTIPPRIIHLVSHVPRSDNDSMYGGLACLTWSSFGPDGMPLDYAYGRFPKCHRVFSGRDPGTLKSDIVSKKHPQSICSDLRLSN